MILREVGTPLISTMLLATIVKIHGARRALPVSGMPVMVAVPSWLFVKVTPEGNPVGRGVKSAAGKPLVLTVKLPICPTTKVVAAALVMVGAWSTVRVKVSLVFHGAGWQGQ